MKKLAPFLAILLGASAVFGIKAITDKKLEENTIARSAAEEEDEPEPPPAELAAKAAAAFLTLLDKGKYGESWLEASDDFQASTPSEKWQATLTALRKPLGDLVTRKLRSNEVSTAAPRGTALNYQILQFDSSFEKKKAAVETVVMALDKYGMWKMSSYLVK